jgi:hypothetical protein
VQAPVDRLLRNIKPEQEKALLARAYLNRRSRPRSTAFSSTPAASWC